MCCRTQHVNVDYVRTKLNELLCIDDQPLISDNETFVSKTVCRSDNIDCIERLLKNWGVKKLEEIKVNVKYCLYDCKHNYKLCDCHTIVFHQFKQSNYKNKKKERCTINTLFETMKELMETISRYCFSNCHTKNAYRDAINALIPGKLFKVQDSEKMKTKIWLTITCFFFYEMTKSMTQLL